VTPTHVSRIGRRQQKGSSTHLEPELECPIGGSGSPQWRLPVCCKASGLGEALTDVGQTKWTWRVSFGGIQC
jgi:hypothetical protein